MTTESQLPPVSPPQSPGKVPRWMVAVGAVSAVVTAASAVGVVVLMRHPGARFANDEGAARQRIERVQLPVVSAPAVRAATPRALPRMIIAQGSVELDNIAPWAELPPAARRARLAAMPAAQAAAQPMHFAPAVELDRAWRVAQTTTPTAHPEADAFATLAARARAVREGCPREGAAPAPDALNVFVDRRAPVAVVYRALRAVSGPGAFATLELFVRRAERAEIARAALEGAQLGAPDARHAVRVRTTAAGYTVETPAGRLAPGCRAVAPAGEPAAPTIPARGQSGLGADYDAPGLATCLAALRAGEPALRGGDAREFGLAFEGALPHGVLAETFTAVNQPGAAAPLTRPVIVPLD